MAFPTTRPRRLRASAPRRALVREHQLRPEQLILPIFVSEVATEPEPVPALPGVFRYPLQGAVKTASEAKAAGLGGVILFGIPAHKDPRGSAAADPEGIVQETVRAIKAEVGELLVFADLCLCEYTDHGHCGLLSASGEVDNDATVEALAEVAASYAQAGVDFVAPSDMMDGRVGAIRSALDQEGYQGVGILAYAAKFASSFYGPFRTAANSAPAFGDRRSYQLDPANGREAIREALLDVEEGADIVMVKPALAYGDLIRAIHERTYLPVAAYNVSGEYAMVKAAAAAGAFEEREAVLEILTSLLRAGAQLVITYHALQAARWLTS
jgi:porphobilinogen synthase